MKAYQFVQTQTTEKAVIIVADNAGEAYKEALEKFNEGDYSEMNDTTTVTCRELQQQASQEVIE